MKDLSFFLFKNSLGAKMKKGIRNPCNGDGSTSTLDQHPPHSACTLIPSPELDANKSPYHSAERPSTLEEMILQLELEEELAKKSKLNDYGVRGRMSCVNNSDILRSARNALNQYPRFSLDGKDAMYRSTFRNLNTVENPRRKSVCCDHGLRERYSNNSEKTNLFLPPTLAGESVVWCKPGVVAKLMGLEAMPVPVSSKDSEAVRCIIRRQNLRRRAERHETERRLAMNYMKSNCTANDQHGSKRGRMASSSKAAAGFRVVNPEINGGWPTGRFL